MQTLYAKTTTLRKLFRSEPTGTGSRLVFDGVQEIYFKTSIDIDSLNAMARKAAKNQALVCKDGPIVVEILALRRLPHDVSTV